MNDKQYIVMVGDVFTGNITFHGPFDKDYANQWISVHASNQQTHIFELNEA